MFARSTQPVDDGGALLGLQRRGGLRFHVGGLSAFNGLGHAHYLPLAGERGNPSLGAGSHAARYAFAPERMQAAELNVATASAKRELPRQRISATVMTVRAVERVRKIALENGNRERRSTLAKLMRFDSARLGSGSRFVLLTL